jgi:two-component system chemotaxis sensor kinase CheA
MVRDLAGKLDKVIDLQLIGEDVEVDKSILEALADPLTHLIRNACDHGLERPDQREAARKPETGHLVVSARPEAGRIIISIKDDGASIDPDKIGAIALDKGIVTEERLAAMPKEDIQALIMAPGFSTAAVTSDVSGRGVGMDVVKSSIEAFGGSISITSTKGRGSTFDLLLPLTLAIMPSLIVSSGGESFAIPQSSLEEVVKIYPEELDDALEWANNQPVHRLRDLLLPIVPLQTVMENPGGIEEEHLANLRQKWSENPPEGLTLCVVKTTTGSYGIAVDGVLGSEDIVVKTMHGALSCLRCFSGPTVLGDGSVALILDISGISEHARPPQPRTEDNTLGQGRHKDEEELAHLLFTAGENEQFGIPLALIRRIELVEPQIIEDLGGHLHATVDGTSIRLSQLPPLLGLKPSDPREWEEVHLILPRHINRPIGVVAQRLVDVVHRLPGAISDSFQGDGVIGTTVIDEATTLLLDLLRLVEREEPNWGPQHPDDAAELERASPKHLFLAEDTGFFRRMIKPYLENGGHRVTVMEDGLQALDYLRANRVDGIVSDIEMPNMNGFELLTEVRADPNLRHLPALALTALNKEEDRKHAMEVGFDAFEVKINQEDLHRAIDRLFSGATHGR